MGEILPANGWERSLIRVVTSTVFFSLFSGQKGVSMFLYCLFWHGSLRKPDIQGPNQRHFVYKKYAATENALSRSRGACLYEIFYYGTNYV